MRGGILKISCVVAVHHLARGVLSGSRNRGPTLKLREPVVGPHWEMGKRTLRGLVTGLPTHTGGRA